VSFFLLLFAVYYFFTWTTGSSSSAARPFQPVVLVLLLMYVPMFFPFFLANSLRVNGGLRRQGEPEWRSMLIAGLANSLGLVLIVVIQYATFARTGTVYWTDGWLYVNLLFAVVPIMFVLRTSTGTSSGDGTGLPRPDDDVPRVHHDPAVEHGLLRAGVAAGPRRLFRGPCTR